MHPNFFKIKQRVFTGRFHINILEYCAGKKAQGYPTDGDVTIGLGADKYCQPLCKPCLEAICLNSNEQRPDQKDQEADGPSEYAKGFFDNFEPELNEQQLH